LTLFCRYAIDIRRHYYDFDCHARRQMPSPRPHDAVYYDTDNTPRYY